MQSSLISVVIPCWNAEATIGRQLQALLDQSSSIPFEIVVVDNRSTDGTAKEIEGWANRDDRIRAIEAFDRQGVNYARNVGVKAARGDWILICDADDVVGPNWIRAYASAFQNGHISLGSGYDAANESGEVIARVRDFGVVGFNGRPYPIGANCAFTRAAFDQVDGFDEGFVGGGDEVDFYWRLESLGHQLVYVPGAEIQYIQRDDAKAVFAQSFGYGVGNIRLMRRYAPWAVRLVQYGKIPLAFVFHGIGYLSNHRHSNGRRASLVKLGYWCGFTMGAFNPHIK